MTRIPVLFPVKLLRMSCLAMVLATPLNASDLCPSAVVRPAVSNTRETALAAGERTCYAADLPAAGHWLVDAGVDNLAETEPRLEVLDQYCESGRSISETVRVERRMAAAVLAEVRAAGRYFFCVTARDPERGLDGYRLTTAFSASPAKGNPDEDEPDPDPVVRPKKQRSETAFHTCLLLRADDHGDVTACATDLVLHRPLAATLGDGRGDDGDFFRIATRDWVTISVETRGEVDTVGGLYDHQGHRLRIDDDGGEGLNFRLVETLGPGEYFVRVEGRGGAAGPYRLLTAVIDLR